MSEGFKPGDHVVVVDTGGNDVKVGQELVVRSVEAARCAPDNSPQFLQFEDNICGLYSSRVRLLSQPTGGDKKDTGKLPLELLDPAALEEVAKVLQFGAKKYAAHNWRKGLSYSRVIGATLRHLFAFMRGEDNDPETGLSHIAHAKCELMFLLNYVLAQRYELDDRVTRRIPVNEYDIP